jgi:DNA-directed RNA polymerase I subunit RPA2
MSDKEMYQKVISGAMPGTAHFSWVGARAQLLLSQLATAGLSTRRQCLQYLGSHFRVTLNSPDRCARRAGARAGVRACVRRL